MSVAQRNATDLLRRRVADLVRLLNHQRDGYEQLFELLENRITDMRRANWNGMQQGHDAHQALAAKLADREGLRRQLMDGIGVELKLGPRAGRKLTVSQMAARLPADLAAELTAAAERLRETLGKVAQANRLAGYIARGIIDHLRFVFDSVTPQAEFSGAYGINGAPAAVAGPVLFEMTG